MDVHEAIQAEIDAIQQQIRRLQAALEARRDTDTARVGWDDVGDLAVAGERIEEALAALGEEVSK